MDSMAFGDFLGNLTQQMLTGRIDNGDMIPEDMLDRVIKVALETPCEVITLDYKFIVQMAHQAKLAIKYKDQLSRHRADLN